MVFVWLHKEPEIIASISWWAQRSSERFRNPEKRGEKMKLENQFKMHEFIFIINRYSCIQYENIVVIVLGAVNIWANCFSSWWRTLNEYILWYLNCCCCCERFTVRPEFLLSKISWSSTDRSSRVGLLVFFSFSFSHTWFAFSICREEKKKKCTTWSGYIFTLSHAWFRFEGWKSSHTLRVMGFPSSLFSFRPDLHSAKPFLRKSILTINYGWRGSIAGQMLAISTSGGRRKKLIE